MTQVRPSLATPAGQWHLRTPGSEAGGRRAGQPLSRKPDSALWSKALQLLERMSHSEQSARPDQGHPQTQGFPVGSSREHLRTTEFAQQTGEGLAAHRGWELPQQPCGQEGARHLDFSPGKWTPDVCLTEPRGHTCIRAAVAQEHKICGDSDLLPAGGQAPSKADRGALDFVVSWSLSLHPGLTTGALTEETGRWVQPGGVSILPPFLPSDLSRAPQLVLPVLLSLQGQWPWGTELCPPTRTSIVQPQAKALTMEDGLGAFLKQTKKLNENLL